MKAVFLDRDGTINIEKDYLHKIEDFEFETGALEGIKIITELGYKIIVVTNQSGIARGYYTEKDLEKLNNFMMKKVEEFGGKIEKCYFCPHHVDGIGEYKKDCDCRKPNPNMLLQGAKEFKINLKESFMVGDKISDIEAGIAAGATPILVKTGYGKKTLAKEKVNCEVFENLFQFALYLKNLKK